MVKHAGEGSHITLRTDNKGLNTSSTKAADKNLVSATLNKLASKLYYSAYKDGERNLTGKVEIAEGLTAPSASSEGKITYKDADGQASTFILRQLIRLLLRKDRPERYLIKVLLMVNLLLRHQVILLNIKSGTVIQRRMILRKTVY